MNDKELRLYVRSRVHEFAADLRWTGTLTPKERLRGRKGPPVLEKEPLDRGLWLLGDLFVRQEGWSRVVECPAHFVPVEMRQTGTRGVGYGTREEVYGGTDCKPAAAG
jgi:hypothetical protein